MMIIMTRDQNISLKANMRRLKVNPGISRYYRNSNAFQCSLEFDTEREAVSKKERGRTQNT